MQRDIEYSLMSLVAMSERVGVVSARELANRFRLPLGLLSKVLQRMHRQGLIEAVRGPRGGYRLNQPLNRITLKAVMEATRGPLRLTDCLEGDCCVLAQDCNIRGSVEALQGILARFFGSLTLQEFSEFPSRAPSLAFSLKGA